MSYHYGIQKWITNGTFSDYFTVGCRSDEGGLNLLLIERGPGIETKPIKTSYSATAGTAYITFENVFVPQDNLLGEENKGLQAILSNFNHERCASSLSPCDINPPDLPLKGGECAVLVLALKG